MTICFTINGAQAFRIWDTTTGNTIYAGPGQGNGECLQNQRISSPSGVHTIRIDSLTSGSQQSSNDFASISFNVR